MILSMDQGQEIRRNVPLNQYTTFHIGGTADFFLEAATPEALKEAVDFARRSNIPYFILGGGSNVLFSDEGVRGMVIRNRCETLTFSGNLVHAESGASVATLLKEAQGRSIGGLEFLAGIPGTIGGAIYGNAGAYGKSLGDALYEAVILTASGEEKTVGRGYFDFSYRKSSLKHTGDLLLSVTLKMEYRNSREIRNEISRILEERKAKHPYGVGSCGCFFKNVEKGDQSSPKVPAGKLLEAVGAKGACCGSAVVSEKHANFIINPGGATAKDVIELAAELKSRVYEQFQIKLEEEVQIVGEPGFPAYRE
jgi:UDP-N-acetylmuramate dehydrogenase